MRACFVVLIWSAVVLAQPPRVGSPLPAPGPGLITPWVTTSCSIEARWFDTLRNGPIDYCRKHLRFMPYKADCVAFTDEVCWAVNQFTGEWTQLRNPGRETLFLCPPSPEPPVCPRLTLR
jgi:hypothetical protein